MHKYKNIAKVILLLFVVVFLYAFSSVRSRQFMIEKTNIKFIGKDHLLISKDMVNKLLIQNQQPVECMPKDILDLNELESKISLHPMIKNAEVYLTVNGEVRVEVEQRTPLARVISEPSFYVDSQGKMMPLSSEYSARVVLVHGNVDASNLEALNRLLKHVTNDDFLNLYVTEISINDENQFSLFMRTYDFEVVVGTLKNLNKKLKNFKAFYQKAKKDKLLESYKTVNLQFNRQVVCTKI
ncbi:cell division protein FtsQ/DivIB [Flavobacteriaceae bacterium]|jgi:cell division protein FtsQ|nr:cell division protein FtsQ/DivIB [Flavobacteriaceae bacterium]MDC0570940.1 cell division protein FtsQ/DivIB [Flavobacteriaceae bacterium]|tara:strand:- start:2393 stop:3112 length:720 start_codon:yes stop_codon:yes gene_type:complete